MTSRARFKQIDIQRALRAAQACGYEDVRVVIDPTGRMEVIVGSAANDQVSPLELD